MLRTGGLPWARASGLVLSPVKVKGVASPRIAERWRIEGKRDEDHRPGRISMFALDEEVHWVFRIYIKALIRNRELGVPGPDRSPVL
jgi:hypothetical protein